MDPYGYGADDYARARDALARYRPEPVTDERIRAGLEFVRQGLSMAWMHQLRTGGTADRRRHTEDLDSLLASRLNIEEKQTVGININDVYHGAFLKAEDLQGRDWRLRIAGARIEEFDDGNKLVLAFQGAKQELVVNKTNASMIAKMYGDDTDGWIGRDITLGPDAVSFQGRIVDAIRVRFTPPAPVGSVNLGTATPVAQPVQQAAMAAQAPLNSGPQTAAQAVGLPDPGATAPVDLTRPVGGQAAGLGQEQPAGAPPVFDDDGEIPFGPCRI